MSNTHTHTACEWLNQNPLFLDTETTGLDDNAEVCEIAVIDRGGVAVLDTLIKPTHAIPQDATRIHGITNDDVATAPDFVDVLPKLIDILKCHTIIIYNANYDFRVLTQSAASAGLSWRSFAPIFCPVSHCAMKLYAEFYGDWDEHRQSYTWQKLSDAAQQCGIELPPDLHRARADAELTRQVLIYIARTEPPH